MHTNQHHLILAAIISHGREAYQLAHRYLGDIAEPFPDDKHKKIWGLIKDIGQTDGPVNLAALLLENAARDPAIDHEQLRAFVTDVGDLGLERLEHALADMRRKWYRYANASKLDDFAVKYRSGEAELPLLEPLTQRLHDGTLASPATSTQGLASHFREMYDPETELPGVVPTGFASLDEALGGGIAPGELTVLGGRPGCGKSLLALAIARSGTWGLAATNITGDMAAARLTTPSATPVHSLIVSVEMTRLDYGDRLAMDLCNFDGRLLRGERKTTLARYRPAIRRMIDTMEGVNALSIVDMTASEIAGGDIDAITRTIGVWARNKRLVHGETVPLIAFVDYIGQCRLPLPSHGTPPPTHEALGEISRRLKLTAQRERLPVVALAQLNRESAKRDTGAKGKKNYPRLEDLKASGDLEQDADTVLFVDHDYANSGNEPPDDIELAVILAKGRNVGQGKVVELDWKRSRARLTDKRAKQPVFAANTRPPEPAKEA